MMYLKNSLIEFKRFCLRLWNENKLTTDFRMFQREMCIFKNKVTDHCFAPTASCSLLIKHTWLQGGFSE